MQPLTFTNRMLSCDEIAYTKYYGIDAENLYTGTTHELGYLNCHGYQIACHAYRPPVSKGSFFILHGYFDHVGLFKHIIRYFLEQGFCVFAFDLPGHGLSMGESASIHSFSVYSRILNDILCICKGRVPTPWHAYGQSTGCAILTDFLLSLPQQGLCQQQSLLFQQIILSAPLVRPYLWHLSRIKLYIIRPFLRKVPRQFTNNSRDTAFLEFAKADPLAPKFIVVDWVSSMDRWIKKIESTDQTIAITPMIIQGTSDKTVDAKHNISVLRRLYKNPHVLYLASACHHLPNELEQTRSEYMEWLSSFL